MINASEAREDDEDFQNPVDLMFERLEEKDPEHFAVKQYKKYKLAAGKTAKSILISCGARLAPFDIKELRELMETDEMELDTIGDRKTALFVIISDTDDTFNFVVSMRRHLRRIGEQHDNSGQPAQRDILPCSLYRYPLFLPVQIRRTGEVDFLRALAACQG